MTELLDPMKNPVTYAVPFFVLSIAVELAALKWLDHDDNTTGYAFKDARTSLTMGLGSLLFLTVFKVGTFFIYNAIYTHLAPWQLPTGTWWFWVVLMLGLDLAYYLNHRFVHRVNIGWAAHQAHHSSEYMNFGTALRQKWNPWFEFFFWLPLPFLGFAPWALYVAFSFNLIYQFFVHTETIDKLPRPVEFVFNTPSHHRVHHGSDPEYLDKNYAGILIIWDRVFGTFQPELHRPTYGLTHPVETYNVITLQYGEFGRILRNVREATRWRDKLGYLFGPPGWAPTAD
ncbi:sterol desaturase family protein [Saccharopolyspora rhizosphaerae]|uniref:Sterol desaturase family protein n=1 Tax=Saccharopolyspora rhizosphaerae TaxID=2492662 RepID=A0A3R8P6D9_9PSEU|nr:sterol desaturase family protein [Saccharopolyspora rhizosphaerae]RRO20531.1 sterol desaturase family protein [Saccharopolyspora rhizosphaerae]